MEPTITILPQISQLMALRGNPIIFFAAMMGDESVRIVYECLRKLGKTRHLDFILSTVGGNVTTARQLALLLREYTEHLTILVPYRARSAGTLLCLSANDLVLGPMSELGPIDSHLSSAGPTPPDAPGLISYQDIRAFRQMAEDWFGVNREEDKLQVLALIAQRIFPTSLSVSYRSELLVRQIAHELLEYQLPEADPDTRQQIVDQLVAGYYAHDYIISCNDARRLGLQVKVASQQEENLLWELLRASRVHMAEHPGNAEEEIIGMITSANFSARQISRWIDTPSWHRNKQRNGEAAQPEKKREVLWEIDT